MMPMLGIPLDTRVAPHGVSKRRALPTVGCPTPSVTFVLLWEWICHPPSVGYGGLGRLLYCSAIVKVRLSHTTALSGLELRCISLIVEG